jgi:aminoglycoside 6'-N-acetyltransferase I
MSVRRLKNGDRAGWLHLRQQLWPAIDQLRHGREIAVMMADEARFAAFGYETPAGVVGLIEASLRERPDALPPDRMGYVEALYVAPDHRGKGVGTALLEAAEQWARTSGCEIMGSDAEVNNQAGIVIHQALGYRESERIVRFEKALA